MKVDEKRVVERFNRAQDRLVLQASDMSLETVAAMVESRAIDAEPRYQRRERWHISAQSALIESFLLNIPVPPVYLAEEDFGTYSIIDGKQRLTTITRFMRNQFSLSELEAFTELEGALFKDFPRDLKNALQIRPYIRVVTLLKQSDPELKYEVFTRLNTGGAPLYPQEIRNAVFRGPFNDLLVKLSESLFLRQQLKIKNLKESTYLSMEDVEYVLRYFTISETWQNFSGDYRRSMDKFMENNRTPSQVQLSRLKSKFSKALERCKVLWGADAFKRYDNGVVRNQFLAGMYDAQMVAVSDFADSAFNKLTTNLATIRQQTKELSKDRKFDSSVRIATNNKSNVEYRIKKLTDLLTSQL